MCSGLWSRYGKVIHAPLWFIGQLPEIPLDGELYIGRKTFQQLMSTVKKLIPVDSEWQAVQYKILDCPSYDAFYKEGRIFNPQYSMQFSGVKPDGLDKLHKFAHTIPGSFEKVYYELRSKFPALDVHEQVTLSHKTVDAAATIDKWLKEIQANGGEGLILRNPSSAWEPKRTHALVKIKPYFDDEAVVEGWTEGTKKYKGMLGALTVRWRDKQFNISGMTDLQRRMYGGMSKVFPKGTVITFRYRELSDTGIPKEARFMRIRLPE